MQNTIDQYTELYGVAGNPVRHSLSPAVHNAAFNELGINAVYLAFESNNIHDCVQGMRGLPVRGMSVTIPYKTEVIPMLDELDSFAEKIGAVNTVVNRGGCLTGYNTDALGAYNALNRRVETRGKRCIILGAGGAARAIGYALKQNGVYVLIANRSKKRGKELSRLFECPFIDSGDLSDQEADILINTTPVGMYPESAMCPVSKDVLKKGMVVMDIVYNPLKTTLLSMAEEQGCEIIDGLSMFINQAAEQFRLWTGREAPLDVMRSVAEENLRFEI